MGEENSTPGTPPAGSPGSTPAPGGPLTTPPEPQAGDGQEPMSLDEARKLRREAQELRKRLKAFDDAQAAAEAAKLSETERQAKELADITARNEDLAAELMEAHVHQDIARLSGKFEFVLAPDLIARLIEWSEIDWDEETGRPTNIETLLEQLAKSSPSIVKAAPQAPTQPQPRQAPTTPVGNPGRTSIPSPGQAGPGRPPRLTDPGIWKR